MPAPPTDLCNLWFSMELCLSLPDRIIKLSFRYTNIYEFILKVQEIRLQIYKFTLWAYHIKTEYWEGFNLIMWMYFYFIYEYIPRVIFVTCRGMVGNLILLVSGSRSFKGKSNSLSFEENGLNNFIHRLDQPYLFPTELLGVQVHLNTLRPRQNGRHFPDDVFKCIFLNENIWISIKISLKFVPKGPIKNIPVLVQIMAWCWPDDKPLSDLQYQGLAIFDN